MSTPSRRSSSTLATGEGYTAAQQASNGIMSVNVRGWFDNLVERAQGVEERAVQMLGGLLTYAPVRPLLDQPRERVAVAPGRRPVDRLVELVVQRAHLGRATAGAKERTRIGAHHRR